MSYVFYLVLSFAIGLWIMNMGFLQVGDIQAKYYSKFMGDSELTKMSTKSTQTHPDRLTKKQMDKFQEYRRNQIREISLRNRQENLRIRNTLKDNRARNKDQRSIVETQKLKSRNLRNEQSRRSSNVNQSYRDLISFRNRNR